MVEDKKSQKNKGVNTSNKSFKGNVYFSDTDSSIPSVGRTKSINKVKHELQTVIDLMGPDSPQIEQTISNDADNEESAFSNISIQFLKVGKTDEDVTETTDQTIPPNISLQEDTDLSKIAGRNSSIIELPGHEYPQYICPPPMIPANVMFNSECMCPQMASYIHQGAMSVPYVGGSGGGRVGSKPPVSIHLKTIADTQQSKRRDINTFKTMEVRSSSHQEKRLIFDLVGDISERNECQYKISEELKETYFNENYDNVKSKDSKNFNNEQLSKEYPNEQIGTPIAKESSVYIDKNGKKIHQKTTYSDHNGTTKVDVYYFDHGNSSYLKTTDSPPIVMTEALAEKTEAYTTKFWAEIFGTLHIGISFGTSFVLQFFRFVLFSFFRPLTIGFVQLGSDYFFKPCIATLFNAVIQPPMIFIYNVATSIRDVCDPIAEAIGYFFREIANVVRAFRIVEIRKERCSDDSCK